MRCRHCGKEILKQKHGIGNDRVRCPGCGTVYRVKPTAARRTTADAAKRRAAQKAAQARKRMLIALASALLLTCVLIAVFVSLGGKDRTRSAPQGNEVVTASLTEQTAETAALVTEVPQEAATAANEALQETGTEEPAALNEAGQEVVSGLSVNEAVPSDTLNETGIEPAEGEVLSLAAEEPIEPMQIPSDEQYPYRVMNAPASVHFRAVGDLMCHKLQLRNAERSNGTYDFTQQYEWVKDALSSADYTIANLETTIARNGEYSSYPRFRSPESLLDTIRDAGVDFLTMSNNHQLDGFYSGLVETVDAVEERGFDHIGSYRSQEERDKPVIVEINGIKFGFLAYTYGTNGNEKRVNADQLSYCVSFKDNADYVGDVQKLRDAGAEVVICLPHWGEEGRRKVSTALRMEAQRMADAGVDIILGSHPHVVLPIEMIDYTLPTGEQKTILVAWSMGNFISYMAAQYMDSGIIVDFTVEREASGKCVVRDPGYVPVYVWGSKDIFRCLCSGDLYNNKPSEMPKKEYNRMVESVKEITKMIGTDKIALLQH